MAAPRISPALLARMQAQHARNLTMTADLWRINTATGRRVLVTGGVAVSIYPGGDVALRDSTLGVTGENATYIGYATRDTDVRENDQWRSVRLPDGTLFMDDYTADGAAKVDGLRFTIGTVEKWPAVIRMRIHEEGT